MVSGQRSNARWVAIALVGALAACAVVVYALIRLTGPSSLQDDGADTAVSSADGTQTSAAGPDGTHTVSESSSGPGPTAVGTAPSEDTASSPTTSAAGSMLASPFVPPTTSSRLPASEVVLPASWSGIAKVTIEVRGECATVSPSVYRDMPADLAMDLVQNEANSAEIALPQGAAPDEVTLSLGINPSGVPAIAVYSSQIDSEGLWQRYWRLDLTPNGDRTAIRGTLVNQSGDGSSPNTMVDAETSLQPCESAGTVPFPKLLAQGATLDGWVSASRAFFTLDAATTDGKRLIHVEFEAERRQ